MKCPQCENGTIFGIFPVYTEETPIDKRKPVVAMSCFLCGGTSTVDDGYPERKARGEIMRAIRTEHHTALREFAKKFGLSSGTASEFEIGKKLPDDIVEMLLIAYQQLGDSPIDESLV